MNASKPSFWPNNSQSLAVSKPPTFLKSDNFRRFCSNSCKKNRVCQNQPLPVIGVFEAIVLDMKVTLVNGNHNAHNIISLTSKEYWGWRLKSEKPCFISKIGPISKQPLNSLMQKFAIAIWYLNEIELIWEVGGQFDLKWPQNCKFEFGWARAKSHFFCKNCHRIPKNS